MPSYSRDAAGTSESQSVQQMNTSLLRRAWSQRREVVGATLYWSGLARGFEALVRPTGAIILMYHSVAADDVADFIDPPNRLAPREFERQMAFLSTHRHVISLTDLVSRLEAGQTPPAGTVCITFDDGYLDNLKVAAPILESYRLPATLFVPTAYIDRAEVQWADALHRCFAFRVADRLRIPALQIDADLSVPGERSVARRALHIALLERSYSERCELLRDVEQQLKPRSESPRLTMNWDEVRHLVQRYPLFEVGGHSRNHIDLRTHRGESAHAEIAGCAQDLEREIGRGPAHFSFPYGRWHDETKAMVRAAGWRSAVGAGNAFRVGSSTDRLVMARPATPNSMTELRFRTSGAYPGALAMIGLS